jgi:hypothetical protein
MAPGLALAYPEPSTSVELTAHSTGFWEVRGVVACGPPYPGSIRLLQLVPLRERYHGDAIHYL